MKINLLILFAVFSLFLFSCDDGIKFDNPLDENNRTSNSNDTETESDSDKTDTMSEYDDDKTDIESTNDEENQNRDDSDSGDTMPDNADSTDDSGNSEPDENTSDDDSADYVLDDDSDSAPENDDDTNSEPDEDTGNNTVVTLPECNESTTSFPCKDSSTNYIWSEEYVEMDWQTAVDHCKSLNSSNYGGYSSGWHLPTISELRTLIQNCPGTQMPGGSCRVRDDNEIVCLSHSDCWTKSDCTSCSFGHYDKFGSDGGDFWSSSILSEDSNYAWYVYFSHGAVSASHIEGGSLNYNHDGAVRCVR